MNDDTRSIAADLLAASKGDETEVIVMDGASALTRFAGNTIHQNVAEENVSVIVRATAGKRVGVVSGNDISRRGLKRLADRAVDIARHLPETPDFPGLPDARPVESVADASGNVAAMTPSRRASAAASIIKPAVKAGATASGTVSVEDAALVVANSRGVDVSHRATQYEVTTVIEKESGAGYADALSWEPAQVNARRVGRIALEKCLKSRDPQSIDPGEYAVILEPAAVAELVGFMAYMGFGAQRFQDGTSFLSTRMGQKVFDESVTIRDDGLDREGIPSPFDFEGMPKSRIGIIEAGVARAVVYDTHYAAKAGVATTGHALPPTFSGGPLPTNLFMAPGGSSLDEMIKSSERALLVTRFHYVNIADAANAVLTGLTRDGTFLVERGRARHPVVNLRFTESMLRAFSAVEALSSERRLESGIMGPTVVPAVKLKTFRFSGVTKF